MAENIRLNEWMDLWGWTLPTEAAELLAEIIDEIDTLAQSSADKSMKLAGEVAGLKKKLASYEPLEQ